MKEKKKKKKASSQSNNPAKEQAASQPQQGYTSPLLIPPIFGKILYCIAIVVLIKLLCNLMKDSPSLTIELYQHLKELIGRIFN